MKYGSVCSGIEAAGVAWEPLGWTPAFLAEIDPFPSAVLAHRFPGVPNLGDFTTIGADSGPIDLLVGGTPCQSFSVAGLRKGLADDRGNLALEFLRLAGRLCPRWVVWENVPGVLSSNGGRDFGAFLGGLAELGYGFAYRVLDAQYVRIDGFGRAVPQRRRRVFVVGYLGDWRRAASVLFERESLSGNPPPRRKAGAGVARCLTAGPGTGGGHRYDLDTETFVAHALRAKANAAHREDVDTLVACTLQASDGGVSSGYHPVIPVAHSLRADGFDASEDGTGRGTPIVPVAYQCHGNNVGPMGTLRGGNGCETGGVPFIPVAFSFDERQITSNVNRTQCGPELPCGTLHGSPHAIAFQERGREGGRSLEWQADIAYSLNAPNGGGRRHELNVLWRWAARRLTPRECERLQGFPDDWTLVPYRGKPAADGPRYRAIGNSMAVNVMRWIGRRIQMVEFLTHSH